jgi:flagellar biosynthesis protein FlhF
MQVKKFEAPTIQEALETIKRELGPEAIILQTKKHKRGFGLMNQASVEVTAAISERSLQKKKFVETRLPEPSRSSVEKLTAEKQASFYNEYVEKHSRSKERAGAESAAKAQRPVTATPYVDIDDDESISIRKTGHAAYGASPAKRGATASKPEGRAASQTQSKAAATVSASVPQVASGASAGSFGSFSGMSVEEELKHLKRMVQELKTAQDQGPASGAQALMGAGRAGAFSTGALTDAFEQLVMNGVDKRYALKLVRQVGFELGPERAENPDDVLDQLASEIMSTTRTRSALADVEPRPRDPETGAVMGALPAVIALVGPTGVGKTTTVAKLASEAILRRSLKVGLINLDCYKVAAFDQLATYAKILNVPFRSAGSLEELNAAIQDFSSLDLVLIDTTGRSQRDSGTIHEMQQLVHAVPGVKTELVLSATTRDHELYDMAKRFGVFQPGGIIVSKLDEAMMYGALYNIGQRTGLPLNYFTTGQRVPEDIEEASRERLVSLVMDL